jgi:ElaB/YqjD/DUF883 family membrane-anchored ribosome-binding protein
MQNLQAGLQHARQYPSITDAVKKMNLPFGGGGSVEQKTRVAEEMYHTEVRRLMNSIRTETDPAKIEAAEEQLDHIKADMENALDEIKGNSGCSDTSVVDQARQSMEQMNDSAEKFLMDKEWGGNAPDFLKTPMVTEP